MKIIATTAILLLSANLHAQCTPKTRAIADTFLTADLNGARLTPNSYIFAQSFQSDATPETPLTLTTTYSIESQHTLQHACRYTITFATAGTFSTAADGVLRYDPNLATETHSLTVRCYTTCKLSLAPQDFDLSPHVAMKPIIAHLRTLHYDPDNDYYKRLIRKLDPTEADDPAASTSTLQ